MTIQCEHNINNEYCEIASMLLGTDDKVPIQEKACEACQNLKNPKTVNKVTLGTAIATLLNLKKFDETSHKHLMNALNDEMGKVYRKGPGTNLKRYLSWFATETVDCPCNDRANVMNAWGPDLCLENLETIIGWLQESAKSRKLPFVRFIVEALVRKAINEARND